MSTPRQRIEIYDTTLRDGTQSHNVSPSLNDKLMIAAKLDSLGIDYIEGGYPLSNARDAAFFQEVRHLKLSHAKVAAFGMTRRRGTKADKDEGLKALLDSEAPAITIVGKTWDMQVRDVIQVSEQENLDMIAESVAFLVRRGREVLYDAEHFFDGWADNPNYALKTLLAAQEAGASCLVLCDTNGGCLPEQIGKAIDAIRPHVRTKLGIHTHNDAGLAVANALAAIQHGAVHAQGTINGIGERCGNVDLTTVAANLAVKMNMDVLSGDGLKRLTEVSRYVYEVLNLVPPDNQPYVGPFAFAHKGGMHVHAIRRVSRSYEHVDPVLVGNERRVLISELSGAGLRLRVGRGQLRTALPQRARAPSPLLGIGPLAGGGPELFAAQGARHRGHRPAQDQRHTGAPRGGRTWSGRCHGQRPDESPPPSLSRGRAGPADRLQGARHQRPGGDRSSRARYH